MSTSSSDRDDGIIDSRIDVNMSPQEAQKKENADASPNAGKHALRKAEIDPMKKSDINKEDIDGDEKKELEVMEQSMLSTNHSGANLHVDVNQAVDNCEKLKDCSERDDSGLGESSSEKQIERDTITQKSYAVIEVKEEYPQRSNKENDTDDCNYIEQKKQHTEDEQTQMIATDETPKDVKVQLVHEVAVTSNTEEEKIDIIPFATTIETTAAEEKNPETSLMDKLNEYLPTGQRSAPNRICVGICAMDKKARSKPMVSQPHFQFSW